MKSRGQHLLAPFSILVSPARLAAAPDDLLNLCRTNLKLVESIVRDDGGDDVEQIEVKRLGELWTENSRPKKLLAGSMLNTEALRAALARAR